MNETKPCAHGAERCVLLGGTGKISVRSESSDRNAVRHVAQEANGKSHFTPPLPPTSRPLVPLPALLRPSSGARNWSKLTLARFA
jgi:hypothetical protein